MTVKRNPRMKTPLASRNDHPSRIGRVDPASVMRGRDLIVTTTMRTRALSEVQNLSVVERLMASRWEDLNPLEVVPRLHATATRAGLITTLREGRSKIKAATVGAKEDMKAGEKIQTSTDIKVVEGAISCGEQPLVLVGLVPAETTEQG